MISDGSVLIVDDDDDIREGLRDLLEASGYKVRTAANGLEGLKRARDGSPPAVILLDLMMPVMDGYQFVAEQHKDAELAAIPVVIVTADNQAFQKAAALGAMGVLRKPFTEQAVFQAIERFKH